MATREQLLDTAKNYLAGHNDKDLDAIRAYCSPASTHWNGPSSITGPKRNRDEYIVFYKEAINMFHNYHAEITDAVVDPETRKVVLYLSAKGSADAGAYENEYVTTLTMTDDGKLVEDQCDFLDSHTSLQWL